MIWSRLDQQSPHLDTTNTERKNPGVPPLGHGTVVELGKLAEKESKRRGRQRKNNRIEMQWGVAATIALRLRHSNYD